jgi:hypothetical protein
MAAETFLILGFVLLKLKVISAVSASFIALCRSVNLTGVALGPHVLLDDAAPLTPQFADAHGPATIGAAHAGEEWASLTDRHTIGEWSYCVSADQTNW